MPKITPAQILATLERAQENRHKPEPWAIAIDDFVCLSVSHTHATLWNTQGDYDASFELHQIEEMAEEATTISDWFSKIYNTPTRPQS